MAFHFKTKEGVEYSISDEFLYEDKPKGATASITLEPSPRPVSEDHIRDTKAACLGFFVAVERGFKLDYYIKQLKNCLAKW